MEILTRKVTDEDRQACVWVEAGATPGLRYINDTWEMFTGKDSRGELIGAFVDGKLGGIGKLTRLYNGYGWLETLRVHPDYQGQGLGKAIYRRYIALMAEMDLNALGMYTNLENHRSRGLAEKFGLSLKGRFSEYKASKLEGFPKTAFLPVPMERGEEALSPYYKNMGDYIILNRTFYPVQPGLGRQMALDGFLYQDQENPANIVVAGARFQREAALHMAFFTGDKEKALRHAESLRAQAGAAGVTIMLPYDTDPSFLLENGFAKSPDNFVTLWN